MAGRVQELETSSGLLSAVGCMVKMQTSLVNPNNT